MFETQKFHLALAKFFCDIKKNTIILTQ